MKIIGISGKKGRGKDTAAEIILKHSPKYEIKRFSGKLKQIISILTGIHLKSLESQDMKNSTVRLFGGKFTVRDLLQIIGTDLFRDRLHPDVWVDSMFFDYRGGYWVIPDVRFPNEVEEIKRRGGVVIRIDRDGVEDDHISETALDGYSFDVTVNNNGSLEELEKELLLKLKINKNENTY